MTIILLTLGGLVFGYMLILGVITYFNSISPKQRRRNRK